MEYLFGAHMSVAGGLHTGVERALAAGCNCLQIFTKNNNQWNCAELTCEAIKAFQCALKPSGIPAPIAHTSYLINVASPDDTLWQKSIEALVVEWQRAEALELSGLVMHPGAYVSSTAEAGLARIVAAVSQVIERVKPQHCRLLFENTAGQGSCLGWQFSELGWLLRELGDTDHLGVCFDTCHAFAAGYDLTTATGLKGMFSEFEREVGLEHLRAIHINDSKKGCGTRVDRHEHIGLGMIGEDAFARFLKTKAVKHLPMFLETPKGTDEESGEDWDVRNLATLRRLAGVRGQAALSKPVN